MQTFEVELKFPLADPDGMREQIRGMGARFVGSEEQSDDYLMHPCRDFAVTDEAFRIRVSGDDVLLTYKGPVLDTQAKIRHEHEVHLAKGQGKLPGQLLTLFAQLGFQPVRSVIKQRELFELPWEGQSVTVALDQVVELGWFLEIELLAKGSERSAAAATLLRLARQLGFGPDNERRSYLRMLLDHDIRQKAEHWQPLDSDVTA